MAEPTKRGSKYRHIIMVSGLRMSGTFDTKKEARQWEADMRSAAKQGQQAPTKTHKLTDAVDRYISSVSAHKRGAVQWESRRLNEMVARFQGKTLDRISSDDISLWRDELLARVSGSTVTRYFNLYSNLFTVAKKEWKWVSENPFSDVRRPPENLPREAIWGWRDIRAVLREGQRRGGKYGEMTKAFHIALRTAMRLQEVLDSPEGFDKVSKVVTIRKRKEDRRPEKIPLTPAGYRLMLKAKKFSVSPNEGSTLFSRLIRELGIDGLEFRDSRATALTHMSKKMDVKTLRRISRHKDVRILLDVYYRETAEQISARL